MIYRIFSIFYLLFFIVVNFDPEALKMYGWQEWLCIGNSLIGLMGLVIYAFREKFLNKTFWQYYLFVYVIIDAAYIVWLGRPAAEKTGSKETEWLINALNIALDMPVVYALYQLQGKWNGLFTITQQPDK
jgi:hypothetical protein